LGDAADELVADLGDEDGDSAGEAAEDVVAPPELLGEGVDLPVGGGRIHESPKT
jgi:hypothetical protein